MTSDTEFACCCLLIVYLVLAPLFGCISYWIGGDAGLVAFCVGWILFSLPMARAV